MKILDIEKKKLKEFWETEKQKTLSKIDELNVHLILCNERLNQFSEDVSDIVPFIEVKEDSDVWERGGKWVPSINKFLNTIRSGDEFTYRRVHEFIVNNNLIKEVYPNNVLHKRISNGLKQLCVRDNPTVEVVNNKVRPVIYKKL